MALVIADRVRESTTTSGTGTITLGGAYGGFQPFSVIGNGNTTYYAIIDTIANTWEVGIGTYTLSGNTLSRDTVLASSNSGSLVNFSANAKDVIITQPSERAVYVVGSSVVAENSATVPNSLLANSSVTINGSSVSLGGSTTITAANPNALTIGTGLSGSSYNGSSAVTIAIDSTVATLTGTQTLTNKTFGNPTVVDVNSSSDALRITQVGSGNALVVEDSSNPDATPTVIDATGKVLVGTPTARTNFFNGTTVGAALQVEGIGGDNSNFSIVRDSDNANPPRIILGKSRGATVGTNVLVQSGDNLGTFSFQGNDGAEFFEAAVFTGAVDGTASTDSVPGRLEFWTAPPASGPVERFRIANFGGWGLAGANYGTANTQAIVSNGNAAAPTWQDVVTPTATQTLTNKNVQSRVVAIADGTSITINADTTDIATQANTQAAGTLTINAPTGTPFNGQKLMLRLLSSNVQTFSWNSIFQGSTDLALPTSSTGSGKYDYMGFIYNAVAAKWQMLAKNFGF